METQVNPSHEHSWRVAMTGPNSAVAYCEACDKSVEIDEAELADMIRNGDAYKTVAEAAYRYLVDMASMDSAGRRGAFDRLYAAVKDLPEEMRPAL